jgi:hypothetical protein
MVVPLMISNHAGIANPKATDSDVFPFDVIKTIVRMKTGIRSKHPMITSNPPQLTYIQGK